MTSTKYTSDPFRFRNELYLAMRNTKQNGANIKNKPMMAPRACKTINEEGNTPSIPTLHENNEKFFIDTITKIVTEEFKVHEAKMSDMISINS